METVIQIIFQKLSMIENYFWIPVSIALFRIDRRLLKIEITCGIKSKKGECKNEP